MPTTILLVEDDRVMRDLTRLAVMRAVPHAEILVAADGAAALAAVREHRPDLVLMDILLPRRSGLEVLREMQTLYSAVPVIVISALGMRDVVQQAIRAGARDFVLKPFDPRLLSDKVQRALTQWQGAYEPVV
jgi:CheY-like chemotaxis protein